MPVFLPVLVAVLVVSLPVVLLLLSSSLFDLLVGLVAVTLAGQEAVAALVSPAGHVRHRLAYRSPVAVGLWRSAAYVNYLLTTLPPVLLISRLTCRLVTWSRINWNVIRSRRR